MKKTLYYVCIVLLFGCTSKEQTSTNANTPFWTTEKAKAHLVNRNDSTTWDSTLFNNDLKYLDYHSTELPLHNGVFPTPKYDLVGKESFKGVGNFGFPGGDGFEKKIGTKTLLYNSFFAGKSVVTQPFVANDKDGVFFHIVVLTDFVDTVDYTHLSSEIISRNHPDYIGQGFYKTQNNTIDYVAFVTADQHAYAIVNTRLFDLSFGETILVAPQKDKSLRTLQIQSPALSSTTIDAYTDQLLQQQKVVDFFTYSGNI